MLLSEATCALYDGDVELRDLGEHRLKDLGEPIRLFQVGRHEFPPLRTLSQARLPAGLEPLVGRKREVGDLVRLLGRERARVVTITGSGGMGKTRLAIAAAGELVESFARGVTLVELAAIRHPGPRAASRSPRRSGVEGVAPGRSSARSSTCSCSTTSSR